jgi:hypothetical protein
MGCGFDTRSSDHADQVREAKAKNFRKNLLFLKKKKQKDFCKLVSEVQATPRPGRKSFLVLFFKKERLPCFS